MLDLNIYYFSIIASWQRFYYILRYNDKREYLNIRLNVNKKVLVDREVPILFLPIRHQN